MALLGDFLVELSASLIGAFVGVFLALVAERRTHRSREDLTRAQQLDELARTRHAIVGSVVKNTAEARRLQRALAGEAQWIETALELSVWEAARDQLVRLAPGVDDRVLFARFFDRVRHLQDAVAFHRSLRVSRTTSGGRAADEETAALLREARSHLETIAEEVRVTGTVLVADFGEPVHKRMLGIPVEA